LRAYKLPQELRAELKKPLGKLLRGEDDRQITTFISKVSKGKVAVVGDSSSKRLLTAGLLPDLVVFDDKIMRSRVSETLSDLNMLSGYELVEVVNPPGHITHEAMKAVENALRSSKRVAIKVIGEEDLLVIPVCIYAPLGSVCCYGQPKEGLVVIFIDGTVKERSRNILSKMDVVELEDESCVGASREEA